MEALTSLVDSPTKAAIVLVLVAALLVLLLSVYIFSVRYKYKHIPTPEGASFFLGHQLLVQRERKKGTGENPPYDLFYRWASEYGNLYVLHFLWISMVIALDPSDVEIIHMTSAHKKSTLVVRIFNYLFRQRLIKNSLLTIRDYGTWKPRRRLYDPAFNKSYLRSLTPMFGDCVDKFLDQLRPLANGKIQVPMKTHIHNVAMDVISKVAFSSDFTSEWKGRSLTAEADVKVESLVGIIFTGIMKQMIYPYYQYLHPFEAESYCRAVRALRMIGKECILKRIKALDDKGEVPNDILSHILKLASTNEAVDIETLVDDFVTFYIAGQETTANTLSFALILIHQHPEVLDRLLAEIDEVLREKTSVSAEDLEKLKYTEQVIEETLRLYGPVSGVAKDAPEGGLTLSGYHIPEGTTLVTYTSVLCRMPQYFNDPTTFNPSRFDPENQKPSPFVYFPFGVGHRACIGRHFAMMEAKLVLSRLLQTFSVTLPSDYRLCVIEHSTQQPHDNIMCTLQLRNQ